MTEIDRGGRPPLPEESVGVTALLPTAALEEIRRAGGSRSSHVREAVTRYAAALRLEAQLPQLTSPPEERAADLVVDLLDLAEEAGAQVVAARALAHALAAISPDLHRLVVRAVRAWDRELAARPQPPAQTLAERGVAVSWLASASAAVRDAGLDPDAVAAGSHESGAARRPGAVRLRYRRDGADVSMIADVSSDGVFVTHVVVNAT